MRSSGTVLSISSWDSCLHPMSVPAGEERISAKRGSKDGPSSIRTEPADSAPPPVTRAQTPSCNYYRLQEIQGEYGQIGNDVLVNSRPSLILFKIQFGSRDLIRTLNKCLSHINTEVSIQSKLFFYTFLLCVFFLIFEFFKIIVLIQKLPEFLWQLLFFR